MKKQNEEIDRYNPCDDLRKGARELVKYYQGNIKIEINVDKLTESVILSITEHNL